MNPGKAEPGIQMLCSTNLAPAITTQRLVNPIQRVR